MRAGRCRGTSGSRLTYMRAGRPEDLAPRAAAREPERRRRPPGRARERIRRSGDESEKREERRRQMIQLSPERVGAGGDRAAEEVRRPGPERAASGNRRCSVRASPPTPDRLRPLSLEVRPGRSVEERLLKLAPAALEADPWKRGARLCGIARNRPHDGADLARRPSRVVAADPLGALSCRERAPRRRSSRANRRRGGRPGCVPSTSSSFSSPQFARSAPSCWL